MENSERDGTTTPPACLLRNLYAGQEQQLEPDMEQQTGSKSGNLEPDMEQQTGFKSGKEYVKAVYCHSAYLTSMKSTSCEMPDWMNRKLESRLPGEISMTLDMQMAPSLWQRAKRN